MTEAKLEKLRAKFITIMTKQNKQLIDSMNDDPDCTMTFKCYNYNESIYIQDGNLFVSGEHGQDTCEYYENCYINPTLEKLAKKLGYFWEWQNPACIVLTE